MLAVSVTWPFIPTDISRNNTPILVNFTGTPTRWQYRTNPSGNWTQVATVTNSSFSILPNNLYSENSIQVQSFDAAGNSSQIVSNSTPIIVTFTYGFSKTTTATITSGTKFLTLVSQDFKSVSAMSAKESIVYDDYGYLPVDVSFLFNLRKRSNKNV